MHLLKSEHSFASGSYPIDDQSLAIAFLKISQGSPGLEEVIPVDRNHAYLLMALAPVPEEKGDIKPAQRIGNRVLHQISAGILPCQFVVSLAENHIVIHVLLVRKVPFHLSMLPKIW